MLSDNGIDVKALAQGIGRAIDTARRAQRTIGRPEDARQSLCVVRLKVEDMDRMA